MAGNMVMVDAAKTGTGESWADHRRRDHPNALRSIRTQSWDDSARTG